MFTKSVFVAALVERKKTITLANVIYFICHIFKFQ